MTNRRDGAPPDLLSALDEADPRVEAAPRGPVVLPVSLLVSSARLILERHLGLVWVSGEVSNFTRASSGHCYFNLKDAQAQVRCVLFRQKALLSRVALRDGMQVEVRAVASIYDAKGEFQLNVETVRLAGVGVLYEKFARLKARLEADGWFAQARKRPLPRCPRSVGVVTSTAAAALRDVLSTLRRRWPSMRVVIYPTAVQGAGAAPEIARAIRTAGRRAEVDVLIVCRGGGSIEDLWAFNEEIVARAVYDSPIPTVSGVGHETDFTICDFVADVRAPTPTAAAESVAPDCLAMGREVAAQAARWSRAGVRLVESRMQRVDRAGERLVHPAARLAHRAQEARRLASRLALASRHQLALHVQALAASRQRLATRLRQPLPAAARLSWVHEAWQRTVAAQQTRRAARLEALGQNLAHLGPQAVLERGYSIVSNGDGRIVQDAAQVNPGDAVTLTFACGSAGAKIDRVDR